MASPADGDIAAAAAHKAHMSEVWSKGALDYQNSVHEGIAVLRPLTQHIASLVALRAGTDAVMGGNGDGKGLTALDVASGSGEPALSIAKALPAFDVTATDLAPGMVAAAEARAAKAGISNLRADVADAEDLSGFPDGTFDVVTCCLGLMFLPDYKRALAEFRRVLKPGGHVIVAVWSAEDKFQLASLMVAFVKAVAPPPPKERTKLATPFTFSDGAALAEDITAAGFSAAKHEEFTVPMRIPANGIAGVMLSNPMIADMLDRRAVGGDRESLDKEAMAQLLSAAKARGLLTEDGSLDLPTNVAVIVTATAA